MKALAQSSPAAAPGSPPSAPRPTSSRRERATVVESRFAAQAVEAYLAADGEGPILSAAGAGSWILVSALAGLVLTAVLFVCVGKVESVSLGRGRLQRQGGAQAVQAQTAGRVTAVAVRSGDLVAAGQTLLEMDSTPMKAALVEADRQLALAQSMLAAFEAETQALYRSRARLLNARAKLAERRARSQAKSTAWLARRAAAFKRLKAAGYLAPMDHEDAQEQLAQASRDQMALRQEASQSRVTEMTLESDRVTEVSRLRADLARAQARRDGLLVQLDQLRIVAPQAGYVEGVVLRPGDGVEAGQIVAEVSPTRGSLEAVSFIPERDRAFLRVGTRVRLEVDQLPMPEFGTLLARVTRVSSDLAPGHETRTALGGQQELVGPSYRVDLALVDDRQLARLKPYVRPGMLVRARFVLREQRIITLVFDPLRRWLD
jgi:multidrug resistance efflux pump